MKRAAILALFMLAGCAGRDPLVRTVRVEVPVSVPCRAPVVPQPEWIMDQVPASAGIYQRVTAALAELEQRREYEKKLEAALAACR